LHNSSFSSSNNVLFWACFGSFFLNCMLVQLFLQGFQSMSVLFFYALLKLGTAFRIIFVLPQLLTVLSHWIHVLFSSRSPIFQLLAASIWCGM
jgi:hypothetical protein